MNLFKNSTGLPKVPDTKLRHHPRQVKQLKLDYLTVGCNDLQTNSLFVLDMPSFRLVSMLLS